MIEVLAFLLPVLFFTVFFLRKLKVPTVIGYIIVGMALAYFFPYLREFEEIKNLNFFYELAVALMFFYVGMEFPLKAIVEGLKSYKLALIDFLLNFIPILLIALLFLDLKTSLILALALYPTSTALVIRFLVEYKRLVNPEAPYLINILILEDLVIILSLILLSPLLNGSKVDFLAFALLFVKLAIVGMIYLIIRNKYLPYIKRLFVESQNEDYFILFLIGAVLLLMVSFKHFGIIEYLGPFLFGSLIAEINKSDFTMKYLMSFREFSTAIFFFLFGLNINLSQFNKEVLLPALLISLIAIISKILSTYLALKLALKDKIAALRGAFSFVPKGEMSIVLASMNKRASLMAIPVVIITIAIGTVLFIFADKIVNLIQNVKIKQKS